MEVNDTGEGIQYVTTDTGEQQIYIQNTDGSMAGGQSLLQGEYYYTIAVICC